MVQSSTKDVRLFASMAAMGIPWQGETGAVSHGDRVWMFGEVSDCGKWTTTNLLKWWRESDFQSKNPRHPFTVVKSCMASGVGIKRHIMDGGGIRQKPSGDSYVIERIEDGTQAKPCPIASDDTSFVAALSAVGFKVWESESSGSRIIYGISRTSETYGYEYAQARAWWLDKAFEERNGQHPFAYAKAVSVTYRNAVDALIRDRPLVEWKPKGSYGKALIHPDCSAATEQEVASWLRGE